MTSVFILGDSSFMRTMLRSRLHQYDDLTIVGDGVSDSSLLIQIEKLKPNIILYDLEKNNIDSLQIIKNIVHKIPSATIVVLLNLTSGGADIALKAIEYGAVDFIHKEMSIVNINLQTFDNALRYKIAQWGGTHRPSTYAQKEFLESFTKKQAIPSVNGSQRQRLKGCLTKPSKPIELVLIGISTGGPVTLLNILNGLRHLRCPVVIAQHMPEAFTDSLSSHLRAETNLNVIEGHQGLILEPGMIVVARGGTDSHVRLTSDRRLILEENFDAQQSIHPSIDMLFKSVTPLHCGVLAIIMTGMGKDGLEGVKTLHAKGATIVAQDPDTCVVSSMPNAIIENDLATYVLRPDEITRLLKEWFEEEPL